MSVTADDAPTKIYGIGETDRKANKADQHLRDSNENWSQNDIGVITATYQIVGDYWDAIKAMKKQKSHPKYDDIHLTNFGAQRMSGGLGRVTGTFKGCPKEQHYVTSRIKVSTRGEPIETHPFFKEGQEIPKGTKEFKDGNSNAYGYKFGGAISASGSPDGSNQAKFDVVNTVDIFRAFPKQSYFDLPGIQQYLEINVVLSCVIVSHVEEGKAHVINTYDFKEGGFCYAVGQKAEPPDCIALDKFNKAVRGTTPKRNWLVTRADIHYEGSALVQEVDFTLSGVKGWNQLVYNSSTQAKLSRDDNWQTSY